MTSYALVRSFRKYKSQTPYKKTLTGFYTLMATTSLTLYTLFYLILFIGKEVWLSQLFYGLANESFSIFLNIATYEMVMILDGVNMEPGAQRGLEKITRTTRRRILIGRAIAFPINASLYCVSAYCMKQNLLLAQIWFASLLHLMLLPHLIYFTHVARKKGELIVKILRKIILLKSDTTAFGTVLQKRDFETLKMIATSHAIVTIIPKIFWVGIFGCVEVLCECGWTGYAMYRLNNGAQSAMVWSSFLVAARLLLLAIPFYGVAIWLGTFIHVDPVIEESKQPRQFMNILHNISRKWLDNGVFDDYDGFV